jgi:hypothetical protein
MSQAMKRSLNGTLLRALGLACAAVPFAFALLRAVRTGTDFRYFWVALGALCGAATMAVARRDGRTWNAAVALSVAVFVAATLLAVLAALLIGTTLGPGVLVVGAGFGFCFAAGCLLHLCALMTST